MIGYLILAKRVNELVEGGFDYLPVSNIFLDPLELDYMFSGLAPPDDEMEFIIREIDLGDLMYEYVARLIDVTDGDTVRVEVTLIDDALDVGFGVTSYRHETKREKIRLYGVNTPEIRAAGTEGEDARAFVGAWIVEHCPEGTFTLNTFKTSGVDADDKQEKYGRYLAIITAPDGHRLNDDLVAAGQAVPYMVK